MAGFRKRFFKSAGDQLNEHTGSPPTVHYLYHGAIGHALAAGVLVRSHPLDAEFELRYYWTGEYRRVIDEDSGVLGEANVDVRSV